MSERNRILKAGMCKEDITPQLGALLYGYPKERPAARVLDRLYVSVLALEQEEKTVLLVSADLCALDTEQCKQIRRAISYATGVKKNDILYATIHTHSGPITHTMAGWGEADTDYILHVLIPRSVKAAKDALTYMRPAMMGVGTVESMAGINRREVTENGQVILGQNPSGPYDPTMTVISFRAVSGETIGSVIHFAAHPTAVGENDSITRDWPSYMVDRLEAVTGADVMYINGAEGDIGPRLSNGKTTGEEFHGKEIGLIAAADAEQAYRSIQEFTIPELSIVYGDIMLPFVQPPSQEEVVQEMEAMGDPDKLKEVQIMRYARLQKIKAMYDSALCQFPSGLELQQTVVALGDLALVPAPFEAFANVAISLSKQSPFAATLLLGLTNGDVGYLPTEDQIPYGGYEVDSFQAAGIVSLVNSSDKELVAQNVELLGQLKQSGDCWN